jgi:2-polyprenyl-3-methyl-5-hydroxy-6-metoxy-1,4-benzoquinol methylase
MASFSHRADLACDKIRVRPRTLCHVCGSIGVPLYSYLTDEFFGAAGRWNFSRCSNAQCGMLWLDPMPHPDDICKAYRNYYTHEERVALATTSPLRLLRQAIKHAYVGAYLGYRIRNLTIRERALGVLAWLDPARRADTDFPLKYLPLENRGRILDVGCGRGALLATMQSFGWHAEGIDLDPIVVAAARSKGLEVRAGSLFEQKLPDASFDAVVMSHLIEHVQHPLEVLQEARRILKPGSRLVIATPNAASLGHRILREDWPFLDPPRHLQVFTPRALERLALAAGFEDVRVRTEVRTAAAMLPLLQARNHAATSSPKSSPLIRRSLVTGRLLVYAEELALRFDRETGEEIALVAVR